MILLATGSALLGAVLGVRFKVLVLLPVMVIGLLGIAAIAILTGTAISTTALAAIDFTVALQFGYLGGLLTRFVLVAARVRLAPNSASLSRALR